MRLSAPIGLVGQRRSDFVQQFVQRKEALKGN